MKRLLMMMLLFYASVHSNDPGNGKKLFESKCARCHGKDGTKGLFGAKNLQKSKLTDAEYTKVITNGIAFMPAWKKRLSGDQITEVIHYIKELKK
ncbi:cytochrome c [Flavobacterium amniphilum]|uniref:c-type cytochrome n=1 Tax=Flavobacterium amniphilum TaxID=1834035 RepID=UPI002029E413|nr:cytochrome c [Flavobacterium amniphilum]MCL9804319.1 cytochrome c [Flavobacterium amniphilum]